MSQVKQQLWLEPLFDLELALENNMHISKMSNSKYLKKDDVEPPLLLTVSKISQQNVAMESESPEMKWIMHFSDNDKPLVLNTTNITLASIAFNSEETGDWHNKKIVLYNDPTIMYAGKVTGGIRLRAPKPPVDSQAQEVANKAFDDALGF